MKKIISLILAVTFVSLLFSSFASAKENSVTHLTASISKNGQYVELEAEFSLSDIEKYSGKTLSLFAVAPGSYPGEEPAEQKDITVRDRLSLQVSFRDKTKTCYVLAYEDEEEGVTPATNYAYVSNPDVLAANTYDYPEVKSKKGLDITMFADAQLLGASHAVIKVPINEYLTTDTSNATVYKFGGFAYYFDKSRTALLDHTVKTYSDAGIRVYIQLLLTKRGEGQPEYLYFADADEKADCFAINVYSKQACDTLYAFVSYLAERYTSENRVGFCGSYILGSEVNSNRYKNNAGPMSVSEYTEAYAAALRIVDSALRSVYSNGRVYVSVANNFNKPSYDNNADSTLDYSVMDFCSHLSDKIKEGGDIPWRLSVDPYNIDRNKADFKDAEGSEYSYDARYITMDNINIITSLFSQPAYMYNGQRRPVIIGEISYPCGGNTEDEQKAQAAAFSLAYYKAEANEQIEAIIYSQQVDSASDEKNAGLYTRANGTENTADIKKSIYNVFRYIDTDYSNVITEPYLSYYGLTTWGEAVSGYSLSQPSRRYVISGSGTSETPGLKNASLVKASDFNKAELDFYPSENTRMITTERDGEAAALYGSEYSLIAELNTASYQEYRGVSVNGDFDVADAEYAVLDMKLTSDDKTGVADVVLRLNGKNENGADAVYEGLTSVTFGQYYRIYFDLTEFRGVCKDSVYRISVWAKPHKEEDNGQYKMLINGVSFAKHDKDAAAGSVAKTIIVIIICIILLAAAAYAIMYLRAYIIYRKKKKRIEDKRRKNK
ncbi:MAG: hypothetical protein IJT49_04380 [Clostridia bacterium]|nr:hypothetical protein [Clostridia bacterium]